MSLSLRLSSALILCLMPLAAMAASRPQSNPTGESDSSLILLAPSADGGHEPSYAGYQDLPQAPRVEVLPADPALEFQPPESLQVDGPMPGHMHDGCDPCCEPHGDCCEEICCDSHDCHTDCVERGFVWRLFHPRYWHVFHRHRCHYCGNDCEGAICDCEHHSHGGPLRNLLRRCCGWLHRDRHDECCECDSCDMISCGSDGYPGDQMMGESGFGSADAPFAYADESEVYQADPTPPTRTYRRRLQDSEVVPVPRVEREGASSRKPVLPPAALIGPGLDVETSSDRTKRPAEDDRVVHATPRLGAPLPLELLSVSL